MANIKFNFCPMELGHQPKMAIEGQKEGHYSIQKVA